MHQQPLIRAKPWPVLALVIHVSILLAACNSSLPPTPVATVTFTAMPSATATPTIVWFPPTATATIFPTPVVTPTQDLRPQLGELLLEDHFTNASAWMINQSASSSIALGNEALTLALDQPGGYLFSLRNKPKLGDFYLEITAATSLCRGLDEYGLLLRVSPALEFYRYSLSCNGQVRLDRYYKGQASSPHPWSLSGEVPPGAPGITRLGVSARGKRLDFFINGVSQFSIQDPSLSEGGLGVFIRSAGDNAVTVSFSDLMVYSLR